jgi:hypothetical protein
MGHAGAAGSRPSPGLSGAGPIVSSCTGPSPASQSRPAWLGGPLAKPSALSSSRRGPVSSRRCCFSSWETPASLACGGHPARSPPGRPSAGLPDARASGRQGLGPVPPPAVQWESCEITVVVCRARADGSPSEASAYGAGGQDSESCLTSSDHVRIAVLQCHRLCLSCSS